MSKIEWAAPGTALYESGIDRCVLYVNGGTGVPWNGVVSMDEKPAGGSSRSFYVDGFKYLVIPARTEFAGTLSAFYSPLEFDACDGAGSVVQGLRAMNQRRLPFGLTYRTLISTGDGATAGYKIHIVYNAIAEPTERPHVTLSDTIEAGVLSWDIITRPVLVSGIAPTAYFTLNSLETDPATMSMVESIIYGSEEFAPRLPDFAELNTIYQTMYDYLLVVDHADGTFTVTGRDDVVQNTGSGTFNVNSIFATSSDPTQYTLTSSE